MRHNQFLQEAMEIPDSSARAATTALFPRAAFDLVVIGASAGGVAVLKHLLSKLPVPFPTPIAVVQHLPQRPRSLMLAEVIGWRSRVPTQFVQRGDRLRSGTVFVAPPNAHLVVDWQRRFELEDSPKLNWVRPAADRLFMSAAQHLGSRVLCVVLSGMGRDGAAGAAFVKQCGGVVIVQDPQTAEADSMPLAAIQASGPDLILPPDAIASALTSLCNVIGSRELFCGTYPTCPRAA